MVEEDGADIVEVAVQRKQAAARLIGPDLDFVVIAAGDEPAGSQYATPPMPQGLGAGGSQWLRLVEVYAADRPVVFLEAVDEGAHAVVPQLDGGGVEGHEDPWPACGQQQPRWHGTRRYLLG